MQTDRIILGIDPGTNIMGFGLISVHGSQVKLLEMGVLNMEKIEDHGKKLLMIFRFTDELIVKWKPDEVAAEAPFFGKNVQSMLKLGRAQGVALAAALNRNLPVSEYSPRKIKQSITGKGAASKEQVALMLQRILKISDEEMPKKMDATDGLAAALCHYFQKDAGDKPSMPVKRAKKVSGWGAFAAQHPDRVKG
jgi:crossover junction endodeoxyribonuclease RuvC